MLVFMLMFINKNIFIIVCPMKFMTACSCPQGSKTAHTRYFFCCIHPMGSQSWCTLLPRWATFVLHACSKIPDTCRASNAHPAELQARLEELERVCLKVKLLNLHISLFCFNSFKCECSANAAFSLSGEKKGLCGKVLKLIIRAFVTGRIFPHVFASH